MKEWPGWQVKRMFDLVLSALLLLLLSPLMLLIAVAVGLQGRPIIFSHQRVGQGGRLFPCYKFRSMIPNAEQHLQTLLATFPALRAQWEQDHKLKYDPRVTRLGAFLRRTSLDELPQLFNVLRGEMSLVGPRPVVQAELEKYGLDQVYYLMAKPGITGLWQVSGRSELDYPNRVDLDKWYVNHWSLSFDFSILYRTAGVVLARQGAY
jgi:Undecaprenyl-phosphate galactose phosphotransferase WbaP